MSTTPSKQNSSINRNRILTVLVAFKLLFLAIGLNPLEAQESPNGELEGLALSIDVPKGDKGILLPKVELTDLNLYSPIQGQERNGLIIENTHVDPTKGLSHGLYMWNDDRWDKLLTYADFPTISGGTKVYTGSEDPNQSTLPEIVNAPIGSIYINTKSKTIFKKGEKAWTREIVLEGPSYIGSSTISITEDTTEETTGLKLAAIAGSGIQLTEQGIAASIDSSTLSINVYYTGLNNTDIDLSLGKGKILFLEPNGRLAKLKPEELWTNKSLPGGVTTLIDSVYTTTPVVNTPKRLKSLTLLGSSGELTVSVSYLDGRPAAAGKRIESPLILKIGYDNANTGGLEPIITYAYSLRKAKRDDAYNSPQSTSYISIIERSTNPLVTPVSVYVMIDGDQIIPFILKRADLQAGYIVVKYNLRVDTVL